MTQTPRSTSFRRLALAAALASVASLAQAQDIRIANIVELSGAGATSGTMFKNGVEMAIKEINCISASTPAPMLKRPLSRGCASRKSCGGAQTTA